MMAVVMVFSAGFLVYRHVRQRRKINVNA